MDNSGWIFLHRKFLRWEWYDDINTKVLFIHCLIKANWEDKKWRGKKIKRGSFVTSLNNLSVETGLSLQQVRTAIAKLESTGELNKRTTSLNTEITVVNYNDYQDSNKVLTKKQQTSNKRVTTTKELKEGKELKKGYAFQDFWDLYDKKKDRKKCEQKWGNISEKEKEKIMEFVPIYKNSEPDEQFRKYPYTFLNSEIWNDDWDEYRQDEKNGKVKMDMRRFL